MALSIAAKQVLKQINIPLLLSLGIHGVFFAFILPKWSGNSNFITNNNLQSTPVIELNQLEQTRIPRQSPANTFNWNIINSLPDENNQTLALNIPNISLPTPQKNPLPIPQINNGGKINLPSLPPLPPPEFFDNGSSQIPLPNSPIRSQLSVAPNQGEGVNGEMIDNLPLIIDSELPINNEQVTTQIEISPEEEDKIRQKIFANSPIQIIANPRDIINRRKPTNVNNQNNLINKEAVVKPLPKNYQSLASKLAKNTENTSDEDARKNYVAWSTEVKNAQAKQITLEGKYPKDACIRKLEGTTTYGVMVNQSGNIINTKLIKSSGYSLFNNQALTQIKDHKFDNQTGTNQPYHVYVNFEYDSKICPSLSVTNLGNVPGEKSSAKPVNQNDTNTKPTIPSQKETIVPSETSPKPVNQNNTNSKDINQPQSMPILPNSPKNQADRLITPTPSESGKSSAPSIKMAPLSTSNQQKPLVPKALEKESVSPAPIESNSQPVIQNSEQIKLVK